MGQNQKGSGSRDWSSTAAYSRLIPWQRVSSSSVSPEGSHDATFDFGSRNNLLVVCPGLHLHGIAMVGIALMCRKYVKLHTTIVKGYSAQHTQDTGTQCNTDEGNTGVIKKRSKRVS